MSVRSEAQAWAARAGELATWVLGHMVNRTDVWGGYNAIEHRASKGPTLTRPRVSQQSSCRHSDWR